MHQIHRKSHLLHTNDKWKLFLPGGNRFCAERIQSDFSTENGKVYIGKSSAHLLKFHCNGHFYFILIQIKLLQISNGNIYLKELFSFIFSMIFYKCILWVFFFKFTDFKTVKCIFSNVNIPNAILGNLFTRLCTRKLRLTL